MIYESGNYTVESVLEGHPDKVCDQICDAILDSYLEADEHAKVAVECLGTGMFLTIGGEISSNTIIDLDVVAADVYRQIGYTNKLTVLNKLNKQSEQLRKVVAAGAAGDQGIMYGYACDNSFNFLPFGVYLVNAIAKEIDSLRKGTGLFLPDGKVQVTFSQSHIDTLVISVQHPKDADVDALKSVVLEHAVSKLLSVNSIKNILFNHNSNFTDGGFANDTGLSGRKIINDTYCGLIPHGGGSFSGKDPSKVDRSASYMSRFVAKNTVANGLCKSCLVSVAYAFGLERPVILDVRTENPNSDSKILKLIREKFDFRPNAIIERLNLKKVKYRQTATYGHFFDNKYTWEQIVSI